MRGFDTLIWLVVIIGGALLLPGLLGGGQGKDVITESDSHGWSLSDAVRSKGTLGYVASGWTTGFDGTPGTCPPNAMC